MSGVRVLVGTRKGAFILTSDGTRKQWDVNGPLVGGCLWLLMQTMGTPWEIDLDGCIFFWEDVDTPSTYIEAHLVHLQQAGLLGVRLPLYASPAADGSIAGHYDKQQLLPFALGQPGDRHRALGERQRRQRKPLRLVLTQKLAELRYQTWYVRVPPPRGTIPAADNGGSPACGYDVAARVSCRASPARRACSWA